MSKTAELKEVINGVSNYVGTGFGDVLQATSGSYLFGLQGDDKLSTPYYSYEGVGLIGGAGNDAYSVTSNAIIADAGGGNDRLVLPDLSYSKFKSSNFYTATIDNRHMVMTDGYEVLLVVDYKTSYSAIEQVEFSDGNLVSFQSVLDNISSKGNYKGNSSLSQLVAAVGFSNTSFVDQANNALAQYQELNRRLESEADFSRNASATDVQVIARLYKTAFDRAPDSEGLNDWVDKWEENWNESDIARSLISSEEFKSVYGDSATSSEFVTALYKNALGRKPDQVGFENWVEQLERNQISREDLVLFFSDSDENKSRTSELFGSMKESSGEWSYGRSADADDAAQIARLYKASFNRTPDNAGLNHWIDQWESGLDLDDIAEAFMSSTEFTNLYSTVSADADFVNLLYQNALGRTADDGGRAHWTQQMQSGLSREDLLLSFSDSTENQANTGYQMRSAGDDWFFS